MPRQDQPLRSEAVQDILTRVPHWMILWGNTLLLVLLVIFFVFTWLIQYPDIIAAEATVTSQTPPQKEYANVTGKIDTLLVSNNQWVDGGSVLAMIENPAKLTDVLWLKKRLDRMDWVSGAPEFPADERPLLQLGEIGTAYALFEKDFVDYALASQLNPYQNQKRGFQQAQAQIQQRLQSLEYQKQIDQKKHQLSENEFKRNEQLYQKGVISLNEFEAKQLQFLEEEKRLQNLNLSISQLRESLGSNAQNSRQAQIQNSMEDTRLYKNLLLSYNQLLDAIAAWELKYVLKAKMPGTVSFINLWNAGQSVQAGDLLFTIVSQDSGSYMAQLKAPIQNSGKIKPNQEVHIKLFNYPETEYGRLTGQVQSMSALPNEEGFYRVQVALQPELRTSYGIDIPFINEMNGTAEIVTEDLRLMERFFYQFRSLFDG